VKEILHKLKQLIIAGNAMRHGNNAGEFAKPILQPEKM
jgi:hypothetical protein